MVRRISSSPAVIQSAVQCFRASSLYVGEFAKDERISRQTMHSWLFQSIHGVKPKSKTRVPVFSAIEGQLKEWFDVQVEQKRVIKDGDLRAESKRIAERMQLIDFKASKGWILRWKKRHRISSRVPTHFSTKTDFTPKDIAQQEKFFLHVVDVYNAMKVPLSQIYNMDQTCCPFVDPHPKTLAPMGVKQVIVLHPPGKKDSCTVTLTVRADGVKMPAVIVFKGSLKTGVLSPKIMSKLQIPSNVIVKSSRSKWWTGQLHDEYIRATFSEGEDEKILFLDRFAVHKMKGWRKLLFERNVRQIFIPAGMTGQYQPLDVGVNSHFKAYYRAAYHAWSLTNIGKTKSGYLRKPSRQETINFISSAWNNVSEECVRRSFVNAQLCP